VDDTLETPRFARNGSKLPNILDSRFFSAQMFLKGLRAEAQNHIADLKLRFAKQIAFPLADQKPGQVRDLLIDGNTNLGFEQFRFTFLFFAEKVPDHGCFLSGKFRPIAKNQHTCTKILPTFQLLTPLYELLAIVLARLGVGAFPSRPSGVKDPT